MQTKAESNGNAGKEGSHSPPAPTINLPKGGGAIRSIGEKFAANPVTGTGSMTVPIATSPGRSGFGPQLALSYDSGAGNGPFGLGWNLSLPAITRKTDKGLPRYEDTNEFDVFILSGAEDLVPVFRQDEKGNWVRDAAGKLVIHEDDRPIGGGTYRVRRYRPRIEGLFARIERWTNTRTGEIHWRSISKDNITTLYGKDNNSRIFDPAELDKKDPSDLAKAHPTRIFSWLICESHDDKGNVMSYEYVAENGAGVVLAQAHERNRGEKTDPWRSANRYLKRILYGNATSLLASGQPIPALGPNLSAMKWLFEVVFDYGEGHYQPRSAPADDPQFVGSQPGAPADAWPVRQDPFSSYRAGFEVRTYRLCRRVLMFHHFEAELGTPDYLVRSTEFAYREEAIGSFVTSVTQSGYLRQPDGKYRKKSLPPVEFDYTRATINPEVKEVSAESLENLPMGLDGAAYQWVDLDGEGVSGILTEQAGAWFYKRNLSPLSETNGSGAPGVRARFAPLERVASLPALATASSRHQFLDLAGDGTLDLVEFSGPTPGFYERTDDEGWEPFTPFRSLPNLPWDDPDVRFVDLDGDGHADVLVTEDEVFTWYRSLAEDGFEPGVRAYQSRDEERGPRLVSDSPTERIYLADLSGDGLTDLVRIRNGEVCYWPNLGYGRFGAKVTMDNSPRFDPSDVFDQKRIRLADIDGSGTTDILYLGENQIAIYRNQSGNSFSDAEYLSAFPRVDNLTSVQAVDLMGNGTACLVWSSPLPGDAGRQMRYVDLMGGQKPHLLVKTVNNLGAETVVSYAPSTQCYLADKFAGKPWITRLSFPVHVVERVETFDHISRNRFVTRYAYHHGYFDGEEREFRGFSMVEQWDTEEFAALARDILPLDNIAADSHIPPVHTKTWFHTGVYLGRDHVSDYFAGLLNATDQGEYFREPGLTDAEARDSLLPDTVLPTDLTIEEEREACRALKGSMLRQEVYADDALPGSTPEQLQRARTPYTVTEQNFSIRALQPRGDNCHAVFFTHAREAISYHYERNPADPRIRHALTLEVDDFGNVLKQAAIGYGRRTQIRVVDQQGNVQQMPNPGLSELDATDQAKQTTPLLTYTENRVAKDHDTGSDSIDREDDYRTPLPCEAITFELTGYTATGDGGRFQTSDLVEPDPAIPGRLRHKFSGPEVPYEVTATGAQRRRPIEWLRTLYRRDDLSALLPLGDLQPLAVPGESYKLAFTPGLLAQVFQRPHQGQPAERLLPDPVAVLGGQADNRGGYVDLDGDGRWWIPSGRSFYHPDNVTTPVELAEARGHFFLPRRYRDPFGDPSTVAFDGPADPTQTKYDLLMTETCDALGNRVTVEANDYRVLQPRLISDPNRNRTEVVFDTLGMVVGTAVRGKPLPAPVEGDTLNGFVGDLTQAQLDTFFDALNPHATAAALLKDATTRIVYDLDRFWRTQEANPDDPTEWQPACAATLARETHVSAPLPTQGLKIQLSFSYSDGFGREIQKKIQAEPGPLVEGGPRVNPRWVGSGWTIFNNKGKPVRQYEPFFSAAHRFEFGVSVGVSPILFYDPAERVIATLHPSHTFEKVVFDPWQQTASDINDTCAARNAQTGDPRTDPDIAGYIAEYFKTQPATWQTWHAQRIGGALGQDERNAALRAAAHADTSTTTHFDALGRPFLTLARNRVVCPGHDLDDTEDSFATRVELDIEGNQHEVRDERRLSVNHLPTGAVEQRIVMRYAYDMLGNRINQLSMEAGARWMLNDAAGKPIRAWDSRGHNFTTTYDALRRPIEQTLRGTTSDSDPRTLNRDILVDRIEYGEPPPNAAPPQEALAQKLNLRTRIYRHFDSAGVATNARLDANGSPIEAYDFKGNLLRSTRRLVSDYTAIPDWLLNPQLDDESFEGSTRYDALNRPIQSIAPHSSLTRPEHPNKFNVIQPAFNEANLLERVDVWLERASEPAGLLDANNDAPSPVGVANIDYDAKGQRVLIDYKTRNNTVIRTRYSYDPETFRLTHLYTRRGVDPQTAQGVAFTKDCDNPAPPPPTIAAPDIPPEAKACGLQNLHYTYDPAGNITHIQDDAQQTIYFRNKRVEPSNDYTYDALYRLIQADGREHLGQLANSDPKPPTAPDGFNTFHTRLDHPGNGQAMGTYIERYVYDAVGNFLQMQHRGSEPAHAGWTRRYTYAEASLIEGGKQTNRLSSTQVSNGIASALEPYQHDAHGNMVRMPHLGGGLAGPNMHWDYKDQLRKTDLGNGGAAFYVYDASGQRVRKVWEKSPGLTEERIYMGGFEIFRRHAGPIRANTATLERETLHVMDDKQRIALLETRTLDKTGSDQAPRLLIRYQFGNHLGSASLELDEQAQIISKEEYAPYGSSTYQAVRSQTETAKRYRYTGKERDEESGLYYHGARYYAVWLGLWTSSDPIGLRGGKNLYAYAHNNPVILIDPNGTDPKPKKSEKPPKEEPRFVPPVIPDFKDKASHETITYGGRSVDAYLFPGTSKETLLIVGGVHQDEKNALQLSNKLLAALQAQKDKPFYNIVFIPDLFHGRKIDPGTHGDIDKTPTNRNFPEIDQSLTDTVKKGRPKDQQGRNILPENVVLIATAEKFRPSASLSIHSHGPTVDSQIDTKGAASITVDPKPGDEPKADFVATEAALAANKAGVPTPGNRVDQTRETARTRYPNDTAPAPPGVTFGNWGSHRGGMNQYLIETEGYTTPKGQTDNYSGWVPIVQEKILADPADVAAAALVRRWSPVWATIKQAYGF